MANISVGNMNVRYRNNEVENINIDYNNDINKSSVTGKGKFSIDNSEYSGDINDLHDICKNHALNNISDLSVKIRSINIVYKGDEIDNVQVIFRAELNENELIFRGDFSM